MATLPTSASLTGAATTNATQKLNLAAMRDFSADLLGTDSANKAAARDTLGIGTGSFRNKADNGGMMVAQRTTAASLSTSMQIGKVDRFWAFASGGVVSAGTITQDTAATIGRTGYALHLSGVTLSAGSLLIRQRLPSLRTRQLKSVAAAFSCKILHDVGSSINVQVAIVKANAADDFSATTAVTTGPLQSIPTGVETTVLMPGAAMGDVSNGLQVSLTVTTNAITTKNVRVTEWQIEEVATVGSSAVTSFEYKPYEYELAQCQRYLPAFSAAGVIDDVAQGGMNTTSQAAVNYQFLVEPRVPPTGITVSAVGHFTLSNMTVTSLVTALTFNAASRRSVRMVVTGTGAPYGANQPANLYATNASGQILFTGAEL
jgi:hypothetical protein